MSGSNLPLDLVLVPGEGGISKCSLLGWESKSHSASQHDQQRETLAVRCGKEAGTVVWFSHLLNFLLFVEIQSQRLYHSPGSRGRCFFLEFPCFFFDPADIGTLISGSSFFSKSSLNILEVLSSHSVEA